MSKGMTEFQKKLKRVMHDYVRCSYKIARLFPRDEVYGAMSQLKRAAMSVMLNYLEGYGRRKYKTRLNFYEISYASLRETKYIYYFALEESWIEKQEYEYGMKLAEEIGAMLWSEIVSTEDSIEKGF